MKNKLLPYAPPGINLQAERNFFFFGLIASALFSLGFLNRYYEVRRFLLYRLPTFYRSGNGQQVPVNDTVMSDFIQLLGNALSGFFILALCMLLLAAYHYFYHFQGSKSIYLMRRLPNRFELAKRCLTLPIFAILCSLLSAFLLLLIYYGIYMICTPEQYLLPDQWQKIWSVIL